MIIYIIIIKNIIHVLYLYSNFLLISMISKLKEKFSRKNINSVALKSAAAISGGVAVLSANASAAINTTAITESISAITGILPAMGDMVSAAIGPMMTIGIAMFCLRFFDDILGAISTGLNFGRK